MSAVQRLNAAQVSRFGLHAAVAVNLVPPFGVIVLIHRIHVCADQKKGGSVVHAVMRAQPEAPLAHDLCRRHFEVRSPSRHISACR